MRGNINKTMIPFSIHTLVTLYYLGKSLTTPGFAHNAFD